jgi:hypothetical protein
MEVLGRAPRIDLWGKGHKGTKEFAVARRNVFFDPTVRHGVSISRWLMPMDDFHAAALVSLNRQVLDPTSEYVRITPVGDSTARAVDMPISLIVQLLPVRHFRHIASRLYGSAVEKPHQLNYGPFGSSCRENSDDFAIWKHRKTLSSLPRKKPRVHSPA